MNIQHYLPSFFCLLGAFTLACASGGIPPTAGDPTKVEADVAPLPVVASALAPDFDALAQPATRTAKSGQHDHSQHEQATHDHSQHEQATHDHSQHDTAPQSDAPQSAVSYTCPMHPEVVRDAPGRCPICGMNLEPVKSPKSKDGSTRDVPSTPKDGH